MGAFAVDRLPRRVLSALAGSGEFEAVEEVLGIFRRLETKARVERDGLAMVGHAIARRAVGIEGDNEGDFAIGRRDGNGVWLRRTQKSAYSEGGKEKGHAFHSTILAPVRTDA